MRQWLCKFFLSYFDVQARLVSFVLTSYQLWKRLHAHSKETYIDGSCSVDCLNCSLVILVTRQRQNDSYQWRLFWCWEDICQNEEHINHSEGLKWKCGSQALLLKTAWPPRPVLIDLLFNRLNKMIRVQ